MTNELLSGEHRLSSPGKAKDISWCSADNQGKEALLLTHFVLSSCTKAVSLIASGSLSGG